MGLSGHGHRLYRIAILEDAYRASRLYSNEGEPKRFCAISRPRVGSHRPSTWATFESFDDAATHLADGVLNGEIFEAIFDLDTGERIDLHISTPVVTRAEDQGVIINPLKQDVRVMPCRPSNGNLNDPS